MSDMDRVIQVQLLDELGEIVSVLIKIVTRGRLAGATVSAAVVRNSAKAVLRKQKQLVIPSVGRERPSVAEYDGLARAPVLVMNLRSVFCGDSRHVFLLGKDCE